MRKYPLSGQLRTGSPSQHRIAVERHRATEHGHTGTEHGRAGTEHGHTGTERGRAGTEHGRAGSRLEPKAQTGTPKPPPATTPGTDARLRIRCGNIR